MALQRPHDLPAGQVQRLSRPPETDLRRTRLHRCRHQFRQLHSQGSGLEPERRPTTCPHPESERYRTGRADLRQSAPCAHHQRGPPLRCADQQQLPRKPQGLRLSGRRWPERQGWLLPPHDGGAHGPEPQWQRQERRRTARPHPPHRDHPGCQWLSLLGTAGQLAHERQYSREKPAPGQLRRRLRQYLAGATQPSGGRRHQRSPARGRHGCKKHGELDCRQRWGLRSRAYRRWPAGQPDRQDPSHWRGHHADSHPDRDTQRRVHSIRRILGGQQDRGVLDRSEPIPSRDPGKSPAVPA